MSRKTKEHIWAMSRKTKKKNSDSKMLTAGYSCQANSYIGSICGIKFLKHFVRMIFFSKLKKKTILGYSCTNFFQTFLIIALET